MGSPRRVNLKESVSVAIEASVNEAPRPTPIPALAIVGSLMKQAIEPRDVGNKISRMTIEVIRGREKSSRYRLVARLSLTGSPEAIQSTRAWSLVKAI